MQRILCVIALAALAGGDAAAYDRYSQNRDATNCRACHGDFRSSPYTSRVDGTSWGDDLHDVHRNVMLGGDCSTCHSGSSRFPVLLDTSVGGTGLAPISCVGCHGRTQDATSGTQGAGAGLRQAHYRAGQTVCLDCHDDSNPANKTVVGEDILPPYYASPGTGHAIPTDSCNPPPGYPENFAGTTLGLDNDGDTLFDEADPDCGAAVVCGDGTVGPGEQCDDGNTQGGDCCSAACQFESAGSTCDDGLFCTTGETCNGSGTCGNGAPRSCNDGVSCTVDSCNETTNACVNAPNDAACSDGLFCNGAETCNATAGCQAGTAPNCADTDICTDDACNEGTDLCDHVFDPTNDPSCVVTVCGNGRVETGEQCDDGNTAGGDCCSATCQFEGAGSTCDDGLFCTTGETCNGAGTCGNGAARSCNDGVSCTVDSCNETTNACVNAPSDAACSDGLFCNGVETCSATAGCQAGTAPSCADTDICTDDACNEIADLCDHVFDPTNDPTCAAQCPDLDGDGFSAQGGSCGAVDCNDADATVFPGAAESCADYRDNDCDGRIDAADESCTGTPWSVRRGPLDDAAYAGSQACAGCHATQFATWSESLHARMLVAPGDAQAAGFALPDDSSLPGVDVTLGSWSDVLFVVGQKWRSLYVDRDGNLQRLQWNYARAQWSPHPGGPYNCGACHTTGYDRQAAFERDDGEVAAGIAGSWVEYNIGCEACHGPGAEHAAAPSKDNINRIVLDWTATGEGLRTPPVRSAEVCGNCHYRNNHSVAYDAQRRSQRQYNDWKASRHASTLETSTLSTYCAKCHSPGNATADSEEHYFRYFDPNQASHVACISCHDPHRPSAARWATIAWPPGGQQNPQDHPAAVARYRGTDGNASTSDFAPFASDNTNGLCTDCHTAQPGFRRHVDASPPEVVQLFPPFNFGQPFDVPHREHVEQGNAECVSCHMAPNRTSINPGDVRTHTLLPNEVVIGGNVHFSDTCGQCHAEAEDCVWCHSELASSERRRLPFESGSHQRQTSTDGRRTLPGSGEK